MLVHWSLITPPKELTHLLTLLYNRLRLITLYVDACVGVCFFTSIYPLTFPIASPVFPITAVILLPVETVSKRHFGEPEINQHSGGSILWPRVCCDLEVSNCLHFYKSNLSTHVRVKFMAGYVLTVDSLSHPESRFFFPSCWKTNLCWKKQTRKLYFY